MDGAVDVLSAAVSCGGVSAASAVTVLTSLAIVDVTKCTIGAHSALLYRPSAGGAPLLWRPAGAPRGRHGAL